MEESDAKGERGDHFFGLRQVVEFAKTIFDSILKRFRALQITNASAKIVPPCIWKMTRLKSLSLEGNRITEISPSVQNLKVLRILNLRGNELQKLPGSIGKMAQLEVLNVGGNQLQSLPEEIFMLRNLRVLDVSSNELAILPKGLQELSDLKEVYLNNNINLEEIPVCFLFRCKDISSYRVQRSIAKALNKNYLCDENHSVSILLCVDAFKRITFLAWKDGFEIFEAQFGSINLSFQAPFMVKRVDSRSSTPIKCSINPDLSIQFDKKNASKMFGEWFSGDKLKLCAKSVGIAIKFKGFFKRIEEEKRPDHQWGILKTATSIMRREGIPQECLKGYVECMHKIIEYKAESLMGGEASTDVKTGNATVRRAEMAKGDVLETFFAYWDLICLRQNEFFRESFGSKSSRWKSDPTIEQLATFSIRFEGTLTAPPEKRLTEVRRHRDLNFLVISNIRSTKKKASLN
eukprot:jgi/Bigna1/55215/estExt_Genewise1Plus.C_540011